MEGKKPDGKTRAGYIYSVLPRRVKSCLLSNFTVKEVSGINDGLKAIDSLDATDKRNILSEFIGTMRANARIGKNALDSALLLSVFITSFLVIASFIYARVSFQSIDRSIDFIEAVLAGGGMHLIALPFILGMVVSGYQEKPGRVLFGTAHPATDAGAALLAGLVISALFMPEAGRGGSFTPLPLQVLYTAVALSAGPAAEEIFFRYLMFKKPGEKYGYLLCGFVSSLLFAAVHMPDSWSLLLRYTLSGCILSGICYYRRNIFTPFMAHVLANMILLLV